MKNSLVASTLKELADFTELEDEQPYRSRAYRRAAETIESLPEPIEQVANKNELRNLPGVGENIERKIEEILRTGKLETLEKMKSRIPVDVISLNRVEGIGPKTIKLLYKKLGVKNLDDLESAVRSGKLRGVKGLGIKSEQTLLDRVENARRTVNRILLAQAVELSERISTYLREIPHVKRFEIAGSSRRKRETIGDLDVLIETRDPVTAIDFFTKQDEVKEVLAAGETKASVRLQNNFQVDARVIPEKSFGAALLYFTGSKAHNVELRTLAIKKGLRLNEYGLYRDKQAVAGETEEEIYDALGMVYIEPELRENRGEIKAAQDHTLPTLITLADIKGDLQLHTVWSDGHAELGKMADMGASLGYEYIAITDHVGSLKIANPLDQDRLKDQRKEIEKINANYEKSGKSFRVLQGAEVNILPDGRLDMPDSALRDLDIVLGAIHSGFSDDREKITKRILAAMDNEYVDIIAHPTGRLLLERSGYDLDLAAVIQKALETKTLLEIDGHPNRLDLSDENAKEALEKGLMLSLDTDSHDAPEMEYMNQGVWQARRAWAEKKDILNTKSYKDLSRFLEI